MRHPDHDALVTTVRSWYTHSAEAMGYQVVPGPHGLYGNNTEAPDITPWVLLDASAPIDVPTVLAELRARFGPGTARLVIDDPRCDAAVGSALLAAGCTRGTAQTFLVHVGPRPGVPVVPSLLIEPVAEQNLAEFVCTKLKAFASSEAEPAAEELRAGIALRRAEMAGEGRFFLARIDGAPAAILGLYEGPDRLIFNLATRIQFRRRGIATYLLGWILADAESRGCRSVIINADPDDWPVQLYRRLGFVDEVYWRRQYTCELTRRV